MIYQPIKSIAITVLFIMGLFSCKQNNEADMKYWTNEEMSLIDAESSLMRVLSIDESEDSVILRQKSRDLSEEELSSPQYALLCQKLVSTVTDPSQDGVGIAGPQVGILRRIVAVQRFDKEGEPFEVYPNIRIVEMRGDLVAGPEGCLSVPDKRGDVLRSRDIVISYTSADSSSGELKDTVETVTGFTAVIFQHECDHLDGVVFTDRLLTVK